MEKKELKKNLVFPVIIAVISAFLGFSFSRIPKSTKPASIEIEKIYLAASDSESYGSWRMVEDGEAKRLTAFERAFTRTAPGEFVVVDDVPSDIQVWRSSTFQKNSRGIDLYVLEWDLSTRYISDLFKDEKLDFRNVLTARYPDRVTKLDQENDEVGFEWFELAMQHIGSTVTPPRLNVVFRNSGGDSATIYGMKFKRHLSIGGSAGAGGAVLNPANSQREVTLSYVSDSDLLFENPIVVDAGDTSRLEFSPVVFQATDGEGPGFLLFGVYIMVFDGKAHKEHFIGTFQQADDIFPPGPDD